MSIARLAIRPLSRLSAGVTGFAGCGLAITGLWKGDIDQVLQGLTLAMVTNAYRELMDIQDKL